MTNDNIDAARSNFPVTDIQEVRCYLWASDDQNETRRVHYQLDQHSIVIDAGGYKGDWSDKIYSKYGCTIHIFEPVPGFAEGIRKRFIDNRNVIVHELGLAAQDGICNISVTADGSSVYKEALQTIPIKLVNAEKYFRSHSINKIDLLKINIEGGEYELIEHLIETQFVGHIDNIQVQFHRIHDESDDRMSKIWNALGKTHYLSYQYKYVWENWIRKYQQPNPELAIVALYKEIADIFNDLRANNERLVLSVLNARNLDNKLRENEEALYKAKIDLNNNIAKLKEKQLELDSLKNSSLFKIRKHLLLVREAVKTLVTKSSKRN